MIFIPLLYKNIKNKYKIAQNGIILDTTNDTHITSLYHSSNGYDFILLQTVDDKYKFFPLDELIAHAFIPKTDSSHTIVRHINDDTRDNSIVNLEWVPEPDDWKDLCIDNVRANLYTISRRGRIKTNSYTLSSYINNKGYEMCSLIMNDGTHKGYSVHRLVCETFNAGKDNERNIVNHIDGDKTNNYFKNLEWVTSKQNTEHACMTRLVLYGENNQSAKISNNEAELICAKLKKYNGSIKDVMNDLSPIIPNINRWLVSVIKFKNCWVEVSDKYFSANEFPKYIRNKITEDEVHLICQSLVSNNGDISKTLKDMKTMGYDNITDAHICKIKFQRNWPTIGIQYFDIIDGKFTLRNK